MTITNSYEKHKPELLQILQEFQAKWSGSLGQITTSRHGTELAFDVVLPAHNAPYWAGPTAREFTVNEIYRKLKEDIIEPAATEWASLIIFAPKKDGCLRFHVDYRKSKAVTVRGCYQLPCMDE